jgi:hypothetical protein
MAAVYAITATGTSAQARPAKSRSFLGIYNQSTADTIYVGIDAAATAVQLTLLPVSGANVSWLTWGPGYAQAIPSGAINLRSSGTSTAVTIIEG